jgi:exonuclease SbcD
MYLQNGLSFAALESAAGDRVQFVLVPYPRASRYGLPDGYRTHEEEHRLLQDALTRWVAEVFDRPTFDKHLPTVLVAHFHVRGANVNRSLFRLSDADDVLIDPAVLMAGWAYVALGHIHAPQAVGGVETVRYPGPLDRLDCGEMSDPRGVLLVDVGPHGVTGPPVWLPIDPTPMYDVTLADPDAELPTLVGAHADRETAIVRVEVHTDGTQLGRDEIARRLRAIFPRMHQFTWVGDEPAAADGDAAASAAGSGKPFADKVREYLTAALTDDPDRDAVLALAERFLADDLVEATP